MGVNFVNKTISKNQISCNDTFQITLALTASPDIVNNPVDVFLVLDRSGSMAGEALENLQIGVSEGAKDVCRNYCGIYWRNK